MLAEFHDSAQLISLFAFSHVTILRRRPSTTKGANMERDDIKRWQARKIAETLHPSLNYLFRLRQRMEKKGFAPGDPYYQMVCRAYDGVQALWVQTHYLSCEGAGATSSTEEDDEA
jgi:hypothetical protein